jgi:hypothetical protein
MVRGIDADWEFEERRRTIRFKSRHKVELHHGEGEKHVAHVADYSMGGVRILTAQSLKKGQVVSLRFPHPLPGVSKDTVKCQILWRRKNPKTLETLVGGKFLESAEHMQHSWVSYFFREKGSTSNDLREDRKFIRCACNLDVLARSVENGQGKVLNIGRGGALLALNRPAEPGDEWGLDISGLSSFEAFHMRAIVETCETGESGLFNQRVRFVTSVEEQERILMKYLLALSKDFWTT